MTYIDKLSKGNIRNGYYAFFRGGFYLLKVASAEVFTFVIETFLSKNAETFRHGTVCKIALQII